MQKLRSKLRVIIFSYNRPAQLDLLLRSISRFTDFANIYITYLADEEYLDGYLGLKKSYRSMTFEPRTKGLKTHLLKAMDEEMTLLLCDDNVFIDGVSLKDREFETFWADGSIAALSLRLGLNVNYSFDRDCPMNVPEATLFDWYGRNFDWGYPMSVSGHIFFTKDIKPLIEAIEFETPTQLESKLSQNPIRLPKMLCYPTQRVVEMPLNMVQSECFTNRTGSITAEMMNKEFKKGKIISLNKVLETKFNSPHQLAEIEWL